MSDLVKQITIGEDTYKIGADAENISYGNNSNVYAEIENLKNGSNGGGNTVSTTDLVVENSLIVNGSIVEGKGHNSNVIGKAWISLGIDPITIESHSGGTSYIDSSQELINIYKDLSYKYKTVLKNSKSYFMARLDCAAQGIGTYFKCDFYMQQYNRKVDNVLCMMSDYEVALYHNEDGLLTFDSFDGNTIVFIYFKEAASTSEEKNIHIAGKYSDVNNSNINTYAHVVGGGTSDSDRKNIYTLDWNGNAYFAGDISMEQLNEWIDISDLQKTVEGLAISNWGANYDTVTNKICPYSVFMHVPSALFTNLERYKYYLCTLDDFENAKRTVIIRKEHPIGTSDYDNFYIYSSDNSTYPACYVYTITHVLREGIKEVTTLTPSGIISLQQTIADLRSRIAALEAKSNS